MEVDNTAAPAQDNTNAPAGEAQAQPPAQAVREAPAEQPAGEQRQAAAPAASYQTNLLTDAPAPPESQAEQEPAQEGEEAGEAFEIQLPEGFTADEEAVGALKRMVKDGALSKEGAQQLADQHMKAVERYEAWRVQKGNEQIKAWEGEIRDHPEYGGVHLDKSVETAKNMLHRYGSEKLVKEFNDMGVLSHPEFMYFLMNVSKDVSEGVSIGGAGQAMPETSAAKVLYPDFK